MDQGLLFLISSRTWHILSFCRVRLVLSFHILGDASNPNSLLKYFLLISDRIALAKIPTYQEQKQGLTITLVNSVLKNENYFLPRYYNYSLTSLACLSLALNLCLLVSRSSLDILLPFVTFLSLFINSLGMTTSVFLLRSSTLDSAARFSILRTVESGLLGTKIYLIKLRLSSSLRRRSPGHNCAI